MAELDEAPHNPLLKIRQFARLAQVSIRTVRFYDQRGLLPAAWVDPYTGYRYYTLDQLDRLHAILAFKRFGCSLADIGALLRASTTPAQRLTALRGKRTELQQTIARHQRQLAELDDHIHHLEEDVVMTQTNIALRSLPPLHVATIATRIGLEQPLAELVPTLWQLPVSDQPAVAVWADDDRDVGETHMRVLLAVPISATGVVPSATHIEDLPAVSAACAVHRGPPAALGETYARIHRWCAEHGYRRSGPSRTVFVRPLSPAIHDEAQIEIQLPVVPEHRLDAVQKILAPGDLPRWSERARQVVAIAVAERPPVTTHRLLVALLGIPKGFASHVLRQLGASDQAIGRLATPLGAEGEALLHDGVWTEPARATLAGAAVEANARSHAHIGTEHLLLSLVQQPTSLAVRALGAAGIAPETVRAGIEQQLRRQP